MGWPLAPGPGQPPECTKGPPTVLRFEFKSTSGRTLPVEVVWRGVNTGVTVIMGPPAMPVTPTPSAAPVVKLPSTGARPEGAGSSVGGRLVVVAVTIGTLGLLAAVTSLYGRPGARR